MADSVMERIIMVILSIVVFIILWPVWLFYSGRDTILDTFVLYTNFGYILFLLFCVVYALFFL